MKELSLESDITDKTVCLLTRETKPEKFNQSAFVRTRRSGGVILPQKRYKEELIWSVFDSDMGLL